MLSCGSLSALLTVSRKLRLYHHPFGVPRTRVPFARSGLLGLVVEPSAYSYAAWLLIALAFTLGVPSNSRGYSRLLTQPGDNVYP